VEAWLSVEVLGIERRRRWTDAAKLEILGEVSTNGWTVADVARRHDLTRQHLYQWRRELRVKGLWSGTVAGAFASVELLPEASAALRSDICTGGAPEITIMLRNGRQLRCRETISDKALSHLLRVLEAS